MEVFNEGNCLSDVFSRFIHPGGLAVSGISGFFAGGQRKPSAPKIIAISISQHLETSISYELDEVGVDLL